MTRYWYIEMAFGMDRESIARSVGTDSPEALVQLNYAAEARLFKDYAERGIERGHPQRYRVSYAREITKEEADAWDEREIAES